MDYSIKGGKPESARIQALVAAVRPEGEWSATARALDAASKGVLARVVARGDLGQAAGRTLTLHDVPGIRADRIILVNPGKDGALTDADYRKVVRGALTALLATPATGVLWCLGDVTVAGREPAWVAREAAVLAGHETFRFHDYLSEPGETLQVALRRFVYHCSEGSSRSPLQKAMQQAAAMDAGVAYARRLGNLPGNVCHPSFLASEARKLAGEHDALSVRVLDEKQMQRLGMGAFLSVTAGSAQPARLIVLEYRNGPKNARPLALVGKGITFDTGGISLKPGPGMDEMKFDMCGAASVLGTFRSLVDMQLPINVVGLIAAAENMPSGTASRPGDIVTTMSGQTVEILNTDAEGRLVLCDTLTYAERYKPAAVVDIATLTGACVVALGNPATGLFANDDDLADELLAAGEATGDRAWRLPVWDDYQPQLKSNFADMANIGGREAGAITAACFLSRFARNHTWAHLDIAGSAWNSGARKGATGRPVLLLTEWLSRRASKPTA